jgi:CRP-like cAMP-binding protein
MTDIELFSIGKLELRKHLERFVSLTDDEFEQALTYFSTNSVKRETVLLQPGESVHYTFWIIKGLLYSTLQNEQGKEHVMQFAIENCWITDQQGFYNQAPASLKIQAHEDSTVFKLSFQDRERMCEALPKMNHFFRRKANDSFVKQQKRLLTYMTSNAQERFDQMMTEYPGLVQRVPKHILAAYLGVSRETLSRFPKK